MPCEIPTEQSNLQGRSGGHTRRGGVGVRRTRFRYDGEAVELRKTLAVKDKIGTSEEAIALPAASWARVEGYFDKGMDWIESPLSMEQELN
jgi:hypothetical protein